MAEQIEKKAPSADKLKALQLAMEKIEKEHGKGTIMKMGEENVEDVSVIPSGSIGLNLALGVGGYILKEELLKYMVLNQVVKLLWLFTQ